MASVASVGVWQVWQTNIHSSSVPNMLAAKNMAKARRTCQVPSIFYPSSRVSSCRVSTAGMSRNLFARLVGPSSLGAHAAAAADPASILNSSWALVLIDNEFVSRPCDEHGMLFFLPRARVCVRVCGLRVAWVRRTGYLHLQDTWLADMLVPGFV